ncbi:MAG TPA: universal stress protein [Blastocatellia bacterium]|nr:universal stress protein [Blastocatellia bacterium]
MRSEKWQPRTSATRDYQALRRTDRSGCRFAAKKRITAETVVRPGDARSVIVDEAIEWSADLIVVGSHGYSGIKRWLLGSVAHSVVSHAPCSVHVVRKRAAETA